MSELNSDNSIVITGASSGIGKACALYLDELGYTVFAGVRREEDASALKAVASDNLKPILLDVTSQDMISSALVEVSENLEEHGLAGLVNNAGIPLGGPLEFLSLSDFRNQIEVNLIGAVAVTQAFLPLLRRKKGRIVNISSLNGFIALPFMSPYAATKFGLRAITDSLRVELRPWGISVSIVEIGDVESRIWEKSLAVIEKAADEMPEAGWDLYGPVVRIKDRFEPHGIPPIEVARVVEQAIFSKRPKARYVVGRDAKLLDIIKRFPTPIRDSIIASQLPEYGQDSDREK
jgi:NAD(P)-dependent dehydrogenase (short-subunit alcohol dehydrogenase family)